MTRMLVRCLHYLRPYWHLAGLSVLFVFVGSALSLLAPWPLQVLVDNVLEGKPLPGWLGDVLGSLGAERGRLLVLAVVAGLALAVLDNVVSVLGEYVNTKMDQYMVLDVRGDLFQQTQRMSLAYHDERRSANVIFAINEQGSAVPGLLLAAQPLAQNVITLVGMFWIVFRIDALLALLSLTVVPFLYFSIGYYANRIVPRLVRVRGLEIDSLSIVQEAMAMLRVILAFGREQHEYRRFREQGQKAVDERVKLTVGQTLFSTAVNLSTAFGTALVLGFGAYRALAGAITIGELLVVISYIAAVYKPLEQISLTTSSLQEKFVALQSVFEMLDREPEIQDAPGAVAIEQARGDVSFESVDFSYRGRVDTLKDVSFEVRAGQMVGIVGPTGAGKSTLVSLIPRFYDVTQGRVLLDGTDVRALTTASLRAQISIVLQEPLLFSGTIAENLRYGRLDASMEEIVEAAKSANAHDFISRLPHQYETVLGERGAMLSGGERQRICVARAFLKDAPILILDEPTSSIDSRTEAVILEALERLVVGRTTFLIAHRLSTIRNADLIVVLNEGRVMEVGTHDELLLRRGLYRQLHEMQTRQARGKPQPILERLGGQIAPERLA